MTGSAALPGEGTALLDVSIVLFVVLLAVLFAVAAVTAGFGDLMKPVIQDARPVAMPETQVMPADLDALRFNVVLRGYKMAEVDAVLHRMAREIAERDAVLAELRGERLPLVQPYAAVTRAPYDRPTYDGAPHDQPTETLAPYDEPTSVMPAFVDDDAGPVADAPAEVPADAPADAPAEVPADVPTDVANDWVAADEVPADGVLQDDGVPADVVTEAPTEAPPQPPLPPD